MKFALMIALFIAGICTLNKFTCAYNAILPLTTISIIPYGTVSTTQPGPGGLILVSNTTQPAAQATITSTPPSGYNPEAGWTASYSLTTTLEYKGELSGTYSASSVPVGSTAWSTPINPSSVPVFQILENCPCTGYYHVAVSGTQTFTDISGDTSSGGTFSYDLYFVITSVNILWSGADGLNVGTTTMPSGTPITGVTGYTLIGKDVGLTAQFLPSDLVPTTQSWTIPGANGSSNASPAAFTEWDASAGSSPSSNVVVLETSTFTQTIDFAWTAPSSLSASEQIQYTPAARP